MRLDLSCDWSYDFITLQLPSFLNTNSNKHIAFEIMVLVEKKPPKSSGKLKKKQCIQLVKKPPKFNEKMKKKTEDSINEEPPKLDKKTKRKINHLCFIHCFVGDEKPLKPS